MNKEDIRSLTRISRSLWGDLDRSVAMSEDTLTSASLLNLSDDRTIERASKVMIERAEKNPPTLLRLNHPFFRLAPIERFLLTTLHIEKWSYARIARTLGIDVDLIQPWAWATRIKYCYQEMESDLDYPRGPASLGSVCPEWNATAPWTQRMLDDEGSKRERLFLQNHLMACEKCRKSLDLTRKMIFKIESMIPVKEISTDTENAAEHILEVWRAGETVFRPIKTKGSESLIRFIHQREVQFILAGVALYFFFAITHH